MQRHIVIAFLFIATAAHASAAIRPGSAIAVDPLGRGTWVVDEELDEVALVAADGSTARRVRVGRWPQKLVVAGDGRVFVSSRQDGRIDVIPVEGAITSIDVGAEPLPLVLDEKAQRLYVGLVTGRAVVAVDLQTLAVAAKVEVPGEARALARVGRSIAVLPRLSDAVLFVDACLCSDDVRRVRLSPSRADEDEPGRPWFGQALVPTREGLIVIHGVAFQGLDDAGSSDGYGGVHWPVRAQLTLIARGKARPLSSSGGYGLVPIVDATDAAVRGDILYVVSRSTGAVVATHLGVGPVGPWGPHTVGHGLTGLAFAPDGDVLTYAAFERKLVRLQVHPLAKEALSSEHRAVPPLKRKLFESWGFVSPGMAFGKSIGTPRILKESSSASLGAGTLDEELALGRVLFHTATDRRVSSSGLSCAVCHAEGRSDGLVWRLRGARRRTPLLTERLSAATAPYGWRGEHATLEESIAQTLTRVAGRGLPNKERAALARYLREGLRPITRPPPATDAGQLALGKKLFHDDAVGCASCHPSSTEFTDGAAHDVSTLGKAERRELRAARRPKKERDPSFDTPTLRHVALAGPLLHDGAAPTLEALVEKNGDRMGTTSHLSAEEKAALVAYLRSL